MRVEQIIMTAGVLIGVFSMTGCVGNGDGGQRVDIDPVSVNHALVQMGSCDDYLAYAKKTATQRMRAMVERECQAMLIEVDETARDKRTGADVDWGGGDADMGFDAPSPQSPAMAEDSNGESGSRDFSQTNNQEVGVDEADLVKTDGEYIYTISGRELVIVSIDETGVLTETENQAHGSPR